MSRPALLFLALSLVGCPSEEQPGFPPPRDDDDAVDDDDIVDDDDAADDDDVVEPVLPTFVRFLSPEADASLQLTTQVVLEADGDAPGAVEILLDGDELVTTLFSQTTGRVELDLETALYPDGDYTLSARLLQHELSDEVEFEMLNGDLLVYELGAAVMDSEAIPHVDLVVPATAVSMQVQSDFQATSNTAYAAAIVREPGGLYAIGGVAAPQYPTGPSGAPPFAGGVPNHPDRPWPTGEYRIWPVSNVEMNGTEAQVRALVKRSFDEPTTGILDVDMYFSPGSGLTAATAPSHPDFGEFVGHIDATLLQAGITLGELRWFDLTDPSFDVLDDYYEFAAMLASGNPGTDRTLDLFFVENVDLSAGPNINVLGVAAHRPGPALRHATLQSGVAIEAGRIAGGQPALAAHTAAHEIGHFLGLMHTSEVGGGAHDNLGDTPESCSASDCWSTNLMDPLLDPSGPDATLTPDQAFVLLRHPLVRFTSGARSFAPAPTVGPLPSDVTPGFCGTQ